MLEENVPNSLEKQSLRHPPVYIGVWGEEDTADLHTSSTIVMGIIKEVLGD